MPSSDLFIRHLFGGGYATDLGPASDVPPQGSAGVAQVVIPFLTQCENVMFELDGGITKSPGTTKINAAALESGAAIRGCYDYWVTIGGPSQHRVIHIDTKIKADAGDGVFADIATGVSASAVPSYTTFNDELIIADDSGGAPKKWTGTGVTAALGGSPPAFAFAIEHKGRLFAAGVPSQPSRLYYSAAFDHETWDGSYITIGTNDGNGITGLASFKDALVIFKGPKKGSIHVLSGDDPTTFSLARLRDKCGSAVWHNAIFQYQDDLAFVAADGSVQRLSATAAFGSFSLAHLTRDISKWVNVNVARPYLKKCWAVNWETKGIVVITLPLNASSTPNAILSLDYRFGETPRLSTWPAYAARCNTACLSVDASDNDRSVVLVGGNDGFLRKLDVNAFALDAASTINLAVRTPALTYGGPHLKKVITGGSIGFLPLTDDAVTFQWHREDGTYGQISVEQGGAGSYLAPSSSPEFILDESYLAADSYNDQWFELEEGDEFRSISYAIQSAGLDSDISIHSLSAFIRGGALSMENI